MKDSAPGPDGLPYSCWGSANGALTPHVFNLYKHVYAGGCIPPSFLESNMVFLPKGDPKPGENLAALSRNPADTRPLNLADTISKIITAAISRPLYIAAEKVVHASQ